MILKRRFFTFSIFTILIILWGLFSASVKFFYGSLYSNIFNTDLQYVGGFLSLGSFIAYFVGGVLTYIFSKRSIIFFISLSTLLVLIFTYFSGIHTKGFFGLIIISFGFFYGLWTVVKNILIAVEIEKTGIPDTLANAIFTIAFILSTLFGSVLGGFIAEKLLFHGNVFFIFLLLTSCILSIFLDYEKFDFQAIFKSGFKHWHYDKKHKLKEAIVDFLPSFKFILKNYTIIILCTALIWSISTAVSLEVIEYSIKVFNKTQTKASFLLFYGALGVIIGNVVTINGHKRRWFYFNILNILFGLLILIFPIFAINYRMVIVLTLLSGIFFGGTSNLIDAYLLHRIGKENKKEHGSAVFGFVLSGAMFLILFFSNFIERNPFISKIGYTHGISHLGFYILCIFFSFLTFLVSYVIHKSSKNNSL